MGAALSGPGRAEPDCKQQDGRDLLTPSSEFFASAPIGGASHPLRARLSGGWPSPRGSSEHVYRVLVSEPPDPDVIADDIYVMFWVPAFVRHDPHVAPQVLFAPHQVSLVATNFCCWATSSSPAMAALQRAWLLGRIRTK
ncbi:MAG TPA: hypothetical protein VGM26_15420 [Rhizomicrobium sp.]